LANAAENAPVSAEEPEANIGGARQNPAGDPSLRKRGRPRVVSEEYERNLDRVGCFDGRDSRRARVDYTYMLTAMNAVGMGKDERFRWLINLSNDGRNFRPWRKALLAELGRCGALFNEDDGPRMIQRAAGEVCELKPSTRRGVAILRRYRRLLLGKPSKAADPVQQLADAITRAVDEYSAAHPDADLSWSEIREALNLVYSDLPD
jgi:hypothetical protein